MGNLPKKVSTNHVPKRLRSRGSTLRSADSPLGRPDSEKVHQGNVMTARVMILFLLAAAKGIWSILEQPGSSIMELHPTMQRLLQLLQIHRLRIKMKDFGGESDKATLLYSSPLKSKKQMISFCCLLLSYCCLLFNKVSLYSNLLAHMSHS